MKVIRIQYLALASLLTLFALAPALGAAPVFGQSASAPLAAAKVDCEDCWAGYGVASTSTGSVSMVTATVVQQAVTCNSKDNVAQTVFDAVAIDGASASDFVIVATAASCALGSGTPTYFMNDNGPGGTIVGAAIKPGDKITMTITISGKTAKLSFKDATSGSSGKDSESATGLSRDAATCMTDMSPGQALAKFKSVSFSNCKATVNGKTMAIGAFGSALTLDEFICVNSGDTATLAQPSALNGASSGFKVAWKALGP
jgi:Peptidase A4 family